MFISIITNLPVRDITVDRRISQADSGLKETWTDAELGMNQSRYRGIYAKKYYIITQARS